MTKKIISDEIIWLDNTKVNDATVTLDVDVITVDQYREKINSIEINYQTLIYTDEIMLSLLRSLTLRIRYHNNFPTVCMEKYRTAASELLSTIYYASHKEN